MVGLLELATNHGVEAQLAVRLDALLELGELPDLSNRPIYLVITHNF